MRRLSENVSCLGNRHFNFFSVGKKQGVLVECGVSGAVANLREQWPTDKSSLPDIRYLLAMHAHFDHVCGIPALRELFPGAVLTASSKAQKVLSKSSILTDFFRQDQCMLEVLKEEGLLKSAVPIPRVDKIDVDWIVQPGDKIIPEDGISLEIIAAPGHSSDSIAAYLPSDQVMFISDAAGFQISNTEIFPIFFQSYPLYMETIERLRSYPSQILAVPHENIWLGGSDIDTFYERAISAAQKAYANIRAMCESGIDAQTMREHLFRHYYKGALRIYTPDNIHTCVDLLIKRVQECL